MKKIILSILCLCGVVLSAYSQTPISKDLSFMKAYNSVDLTFYFSGAVIDDLKYDDYAAYYDTKNHAAGKFKTTIEPQCIESFVGGFNENGRVSTKYLTHKTDSLNKINVSIYLGEVTKKGDVKGFVNIYEKKTNLLLATFNFKGSIDDKITKAGKTISGIFKKNGKIDYASVMPLAMHNAGAYVGDKLNNASKTFIDNLIDGK